VTADATSVYWANSGSGAATGTVSACTISACCTGCCGAPTTLASAQKSPFGIAVNSTSLYWANGNGGAVMELTPK
jgi:hypothetical protein